MNKITSKELLLLSHNFKVRFALFCANQVKEHWTDTLEAVEAVRVAELWLEGKASAEECREAATAARNATNAASAVAYATRTHATHAAANAADAAADAAYAGDAYVAYAASAAADAAAYAAYAGDATKVIKEQWDYYNQLLSFHEEFEKIVFV